MSDLHAQSHAVSPDTAVSLGRREVRKPAVWWRRAVGAAIGKVAHDVFGSHKVAAGKIGVSDTEFGKWVSATRRPQFDLILAVDELRTPLLLALARLDGAIEVVQQLRCVERRRRVEA